MRTASLSNGLTDLSLVPAAASVDRVLHSNHHIHLYDEFDICFSRIVLKPFLCCWKLHQFVIVKYLNNPGPQLMQFCNSSQWAFELETLRTPQDIKTPIKMLLSHGSGPTDMISVQQTPKKELWCWVIILGLLCVAQKHLSQCGSVLGKTGAISVLVGTLKGPK